jgi:hypothetical protein
MPHTRHQAITANRSMRTMHRHRTLYNRAVTAIAGGVLYVSSGYSTFGDMLGHVLLAFSVDGQ